MDYPFIKEICLAYCNDRQVFEKPLFKTQDLAVQELNTEIKNIIDEVKFTNNELYYEMHSYDRTIQQRIIYYLLDTHMYNKYNIEFYDGPLIFQKFDNDSKLVTEIGTLEVLGAAFGLSALFAIVNPKRSARIAAEIGDTIYRASQYVAEVIRRMTVGGKVKKAILVTHLDTCTKKCGHIVRTWDELSDYISIAIKGNILPSTKIAKEQAECLINCYLDYNLEQIKIVSAAYVDCLKSTGELEGKVNSFSVLFKKPLGESCQLYYEALTKIDKDFKETIEYLFREDNPRSYQDWINKYNSALDESMSSNSGSTIPKPFPPRNDNRPSYPPKQFNNPNPNFRR